MQKLRQSRRKLLRSSLQQIKMVNNLKTLNHLILAQNPIENASVGKQQNKNKKKEVIQEVSKPAEDPKRASKQ